jgi:hypothetical protein
MVGGCACCGSCEAVTLADGCVFCLGCGDVRDPEPLPGVPLTELEGEWTS